MLGRPYDPNENFFKPEKLKGLNGTIQLGRGGRDKPRTRIPAISAKRKEANKLYERAKRQWRKERTKIDGLRCQVVRDGVRCGRKAGRNPHHIKGRAGSLLYAPEFFLAVCAEDHRYLHDEPKFSYQSGYMIKRL